MHATQSAKKLRIKLQHLQPPHDRLRNMNLSAAHERGAYGMGFQRINDANAAVQVGQTNFALYIYITCKAITAQPQQNI